MSDAACAQGGNCRGAGGRDLREKKAKMENAAARSFTPPQAFSMCAERAPEPVSSSRSLRTPPEWKLDFLITSSQPPCGTHADSIPAADH
jgi:hypothetical protein